MVYGRYNELVNGINGVYKPTYITWGAPFCMFSSHRFSGVVFAFFRSRFSLRRRPSPAGALCTAPLNVNPFGAPSYGYCQCQGGPLAGISKAGEGFSEAMGKPQGNQRKIGVFVTVCYGVSICFNGISPRQVVTCLGDLPLLSWFCLGCFWKISRHFLTYMVLEAVVQKLDTKKKHMFHGIESRFMLSWGTKTPTTRVYGDIS